MITLNFDHGSCSVNRNQARALSTPGFSLTFSSTTSAEPKTTRGCPYSLSMISNPYGISFVPMLGYKAERSSRQAQTPSASGSLMDEYQFTPRRVRQLLTACTTASTHAATVATPAITDVYSSNADQSAPKISSPVDGGCPRCGQKVGASHSIGEYTPKGGKNQ